MSATGLIARIVDIDDNFADRPLAAGYFLPGLFLFAAGKVSAGELVQAFDLQGDELTEAVQIRDALNAKTGTVNKLVYVHTIQAIFQILENDDDRIYRTDATTLDFTRIYLDTEIAGT